MLYMGLKYWVRLGLPFFAKSMRITGGEQLKCKGPLVIALNHPNSFLDAILVGAFMQYPVHYLTRGDVFNKAWVRKLLSQFNMLPIYRIRDGKDKLNLNQQTFDESEKVLKNNGILLVFVEGFCEHQTTLQLPLKKGAPRVIEACLRQGHPVKILPVWLSYSSFWRYAKHIEMRLGSIIDPQPQIDLQEPAMVWQKLNQLTADGLSGLEAQAPQKVNKPSGVVKLVIAIPALLGAVLHAPLYLPLQAIVYKLTHKEVHYDSVLFGVLLLVYPIFLIVLGALLASATSWTWFFFPIIVMPLLARAFVVWK